MRLLDQNVPFAPRRWPFFYGWVIVVVATIGTVCSAPGQTIGVGAFINHLMEALRLSRTEISTAYMFGTIGSSLILPYAGQLLDRWGARGMVVVSSVGLGLSLAAVALSPRLAAPSFMPTMVVASAMFLFLRFFGQGCLTMTSRVTIGKWFNHRRGIATAITSVFVAFAFTSAPRLFNGLIARFGWQGAALVLAGGVGVGMAGIGWAFYRDNPEECGLEMDGPIAPHTREKLARRVPEVYRQYTRGEALRTVGFWAFSLGTAIQALLMTAVSFHIASIGPENGLTEEQAFAVFLPTAFFAVPATIIGGWLSDRIRLKWLLLAMLIAQALFMTGLLTLGDPRGLALFTFGYGLASGLFGLLLTVTWPRYYGREHLGAISGLNLSIMVFASAIGPVLWSVGRDFTGSFLTVIAASWAMPIVCITLALFAENPQRRHAPRA